MRSLAPNTVSRPPAVDTTRSLVVAEPTQALGNGLVDSVTVRSIIGIPDILTVSSRRFDRTRIVGPLVGTGVDVPGDGPDGGYG